MAYQEEVQVRALFDDFINNLVDLIEAKDQFLKGHCARVARYVKAVAKSLKLPPQQAREIGIAALLHDAGYIAIREPIFEKSEKLNDKELDMIRAHPVSAHTILAELGFNDHVLACVRHHHEHFDGSGYPDAVAGEAIPLGARIIYLAEVFDGMTSSRAHRKAFSVEQALEEIFMQAGKKFDSRLVNLFVELMERERQARAEVANGPKGDARKQRILQEILQEVIAGFKSGSIKLPVLPKVLKNVQSILVNPETTLKQAAVVIGGDLKLSTMLIALANSPYYRGVKEIESLDQAISRLGFKETLKLITLIGNKSLYKCDQQEYHDLMVQFWRHNVACAYLAHFLARQLRLQDAEEYFSLGLTHDVGKGLLLSAFAQRIKEKRLSLAFEPADIIAVIDKMHTSFGAALLKKWGLSEWHVVVAKNHKIIPEQNSIPIQLKLIQLANLLTRQVDCRPNSGPDEERWISAMTSALQLSPQAIDLIVQRTTEALDQLEHSL